MRLAGAAVTRILAVASSGRRHGTAAGGDRAAVASSMSTSERPGATARGGRPGRSRDVGATAFSLPTQPHAGASLPDDPCRAVAIFSNRAARAGSAAATLLLAASFLVAATPARGQSAGDDWFTERAEAAGLDFVHFNGMSGEFYFEEMVGSGVALFDYDNDGDLDVYLVQGAMLGEGKTLADALIPPAMPLPLTDRLYRNDLTVAADGTRTLRFTDVTAESGLDVREYGMGAATGDFDNDGWIDLYLTRRGPDRLFRNDGDGTFTDVSERAGTRQPGWSISASFVDFDRDGWLDLYVGNYVDHDADRECTTELGAREYCGPQGFMPVPDRLYRNRGDGTFADVTAAAQVAREFGPAMGVVAADLDADGWPDLYVANDMQENQLWINRQDGTFVNDALLAGVALNQAGAVEAGMGVDAGDIDNDGDDDLFLTHLEAQTNTLYVNDGAGMFEDRSTMSGLGATSVPSTGFGALWFDYDNDGWLDVLAVNGAVTTIKDARRGGRSAPPAPAQPVVPQPGRRTLRGRHRRGRGRLRAVRGEPGRGLRRSRQRRRYRRRRHEQRRAGAPARQRGRQPQPLARTPAGRGRSAPRHARGARRGLPRRGAAAVAARPDGRQLRLGPRSARARRPRVGGIGRAGAGRLAGRAGRGMDRPGSEPVPDADRGDGDGAERTAVVCVVERRGARHGIGRRSRPGRTE